jgi:hypothetical protein
MSLQSQIAAFAAASQPDPARCVGALPRWRAPGFVQDNDDLFQFWEFRRTNSHPRL